MKEMSLWLGALPDIHFGFPNSNFFIKLFEARSGSHPTSQTL